MNTTHHTSDSDFSVETWVVPPGGSRTIDVAGIERLRVGLIAGNINVIGHDGADTRIEIEQVIEHDVHVTAERGELQINQPKRNWRDAFSTAASVMRSRTSASVTVMLPRSAFAKIGTTSAETLVSGILNGASVNTVSGDVQLSQVSGRVDINTASGRVDIDGLDGHLELRSVSGEVTVAGTGDNLSVETVSGNVLLDIDGYPKLISVNSVSGDSTVRVQQGAGLSVDFKSLSGQYAVDGISGKGKATPRIDGEPSIRIACHSVSGDLTVVRR
ncbi:DUF4097 family beta strand repeat-containing protein [uncultured Agrococcus sp.]|uniref:DUF4097 family beta strand repeat-containing protein n=1 Tax=uncultured Agrococcus sp. TaxID=382258 RepID=UPI0025CFC725|nr:DUF4097 family beta strand repeat-containing protein [uncultured Agrococcus sp.]